jgi:hypothetical protein
MPPDLSQSSSARSKRRDELEPAVVDLATMARLVDSSYSFVNDQIRTGDFPIPHFRLGRRILFRRADVDAFLGIRGDATEGVA